MVAIMLLYYVYIEDMCTSWSSVLPCIF